MGRRSHRSRSSAFDARFEQLVNDHVRAVTTYARSVAGTPTIAEDAVQETFLRAWRYLDSFRGTGSREGWLLRICRNAIHDLEAKERRSVPTEHVWFCGSTMNRRVPMMWPLRSTTTSWPESRSRNCWIDFRHCNGK